MKVFWTEAAIAQLGAIYEFISQSSPRYARRTLERLVARSEQISSFPESGRPVPEFHSAEIREVIEGDFRIIYRLRPAQIDVVAVVHGSRGGLPHL